MFIKFFLKSLNKRLLFALFVIVAIEIVLTVVLPTTKGWFFGTLEAKNLSMLYIHLAYYVGTLMSIYVLKAFKIFFVQRNSLASRGCMTGELTRLWKAKTNKGELNISSPCQRLGADMEIMCHSSFEVGAEIFISAFIVVALVIQATSTVMLCSMGYSVASILIMFLFKNPLVGSQKTLQDKEGVYRLSLSKDAWDGSEPGKFASVVATYKKYSNVVFVYGVFNGFKSGFASLIPFFILLPGYFAGAVTFGDIIAGVSTFELIVINATIVLQLYPIFTKGIASIKRVKELFTELY